MTDSIPNPDRAPLPMDLATLIRCAADDSLSLEQADALRAHLADNPQDQARIDFERGLRDATAKAMNTGAAPAELRQSIETMFAEQQTADTVGPPETKSHSYWSQPRRVGAIAALILFAFSVVLIIQRPNQSNGWSAGLSQRVVSWIQTEHNKCCDSDKYREKKLNVVTVADAQERSRIDLGAAPTHIQIENAGYKFVGYGSCHIPGGGASGQIIYAPINGVGEPVSLFVQQDNGQLDSVATNNDCIEGIIADRSKADPGDQLYIWRRDGLIYYLITCTQNKAKPCLTSLGAPDNRISL